MKTKSKKWAVDKYRKIESGDGVDRYKCLKILRRGKCAEDSWNEGEFTLGIEYGYMIALIDVFNLTEKDLYN